LSEPKERNLRICQGHLTLNVSPCFYDVNK
jgi:hypothetical protein